ncbi:MAG: hypothetical protein ABIP94_20495 [Planctomycetota bacterium]
MSSTFGISRYVFLRALGLCQLGTFISLGGQGPGLFGSGGITPLAARLAQLAEVHGANGFWRAPTLFWCSTSDEFLAACCGWV